MVTRIVERCGEGASVGRKRNTNKQKIGEPTERVLAVPYWTSLWTRAWTPVNRYCGPWATLEQSTKIKPSHNHQGMFDWLSPGLIMPWQYRLTPGNLEDREAPVPFCHRYCSTGWHHGNFRVLSLASSRSQQPPVGDAVMRAGGSREAERSHRKWPESEPFVSTQNSKSP